MRARWNQVFHSVSPDCAAGTIIRFSRTVMEAWLAGTPVVANAGSVYAWGAWGSILGTFATGFFLVNHLALPATTYGLTYSANTIVIVLLVVMGANPVVSHGSLISAPRMKEQLKAITGRVADISSSNARDISPCQYE